MLTGTSKIEKSAVRWCLTFLVAAYLALHSEGTHAQKCCGQKDLPTSATVVNTQFFITTLPFPKPPKVQQPLVSLTESPTGNPTGILAPSDPNQVISSFAALDSIAGMPPAETYKPPPGVQFNYKKHRTEPVSYSFRGNTITLRLADGSLLSATCRYRVLSEKARFHSSCASPPAGYSGVETFLRDRTVILRWPKGVDDPSPGVWWSETYYR